MFLAKVICKNDKYFIICFGDAAAYRVFVYMLYPLQGGRSTDRHPCKGYNIYTNTRYAAASSKHIIKWICGNKMPTSCNRGFYCRTYCLLNMFRAPLCPSSGAQEYYTVVAACGIWCCGFQVVDLVCS